MNIKVVTIFLSVQSPFVGLNQKQLNSFFYPANASQIRSDMPNNARELAKTDIALLSEELPTKLLLYGDHTFNDMSNRLILQETITFIRPSKRFLIYT